MSIRDEIVKEINNLFLGINFEQRLAALLKHALNPPEKIEYDPGDMAVGKFLEILDKHGFTIAPKRLTAENGMKYKMTGEYKVEFERFSRIDGIEIEKINIPWHTIKKIYADAVDEFTDILNDPV